MIEFDVILCGGYFGFVGPASITRGYVGPLRDDQHVSVEVDSDATLGQVLENAAGRLGIEVDSSLRPGRSVLSTLTFIAFFKPEHLDPNTEIHPGQTHTLMGVRPDGVVCWSTFRDLRCADLMRAGKAGLIDGDPRRPYLIPQVSAGGMGPSEWHSVLSALRAAWSGASSLSPVLNAYAILEILTRVTRRLKPLEAAIEQNHVEWTKRGGDPWELGRLLSCRPWRSQDLARLLNCSRHEAEALLWGWGFAFDPKKGQWSREESDEANVARYVITTGMSMPLQSDAMASLLLRRAFEIYAASGRLPNGSEILEAEVSELDDHADT